MENKGYTKEDVLNITKKENVLFVRLKFLDILGTPKNIVITPNRLEEALDYGIPFDASSIAGYATIEESEAGIEDRFLELMENGTEARRHNGAKA